LRQILLLHLLWRRGFRWTKWLSSFFKKLFLVCRSYFFLVFTFCFVCCCGVGQWVEAPDLFGCGWLVLFSLAVFNFIPQVVVLFVFLLQLGGDGVAVCFFKKQFLKSYQVFAVLTFYVAVFGGQNYIVGKQKLLCRQAVTVFFAGSF
jgi:hypothetical protein